MKGADAAWPRSSDKSKRINMSNGNRGRTMKAQLTFASRLFIAAFLLASAFAVFGGVRGAEALSCDPAQSKQRTP